MTAGPVFVQGWDTFTTGVDTAPDPLVVSYSQPAPTNRMLLAVACDGPITFPPEGWSQIVVEIHNVAVYLYERFAGPDDPDSVAIIADGPYITCAAFCELDGVDRLNVSQHETQTNNGVDPISTGTTPTTTLADVLAVAIIGSTLNGGILPDFGSWTNSFTEQLDIHTNTGSHNVGLAVAQKTASAIGTFVTQATPSDTANGGGIMAVYGTIDTDDAILRPSYAEAGHDTPVPLALKSRTPFLQGTEFERSILGRLGYV